MTLKGYRTIAYQVLSTVAVVTGVAVVTNFNDLGFTGGAAAWAMAVAKIADGVINCWLRYVTTTPIGEKF